MVYWLFCLLLSGLIASSAQPVLSVRAISNSELQISWPTTYSDFLPQQATSLSDAPIWSDVDALPVSDGTNFVIKIQPRNVAQFFRLEEMPLTEIDSTSPFDGETGVAVTRESVVHFTAPLAADTMLTRDNFYAMAAGRRILSRVEISSDRQEVRLFYLEPLPGGALVTVYLDREDLFDFRGRELGPSDFPPDKNIFSFTTLSLTPLARTAVVGTVYASELSGGATGTNKPLAGVTVTVDGMEQTLRAVTDTNGNFKLAPVPAGRFFVHIDGRTITNDAQGIHYPDKSYYPFVGKAWEAVAGREDNLAGGTGTIYLPLITAGTLQPVSQTVPTTISFPSNVVSANPALAGVNITVPANSLFSDTGTRGGKVGIAPVPPDRLPGPLPPGLQLPIVITVQTDGALNFDQPAPVCFPNVPDPLLGTPLPVGSKQSLMSFNHKKGVWEAVGTMTVSADGKLVCSDSGSGIVQPGWHGVGPLPSGPPPPPCDGNGPTSLSFHNVLGGITALDVSKCLRDCTEHYDEALYALINSFAISLGNCLANTNCPYVKSTTDAYHFEAEVLYKVYQDCVAGCNNAPPPPPPPPPPKPKPKKPKKPKACRPRPKTAGASTMAFHAFATQPTATVVSQIRDIFQQIAALTEPYLNADALPASVQAQIGTLVASANTLAGGDMSAYLSNYDLQAEIQAAAAGTLAEPEGNAPEYPVFYAAEIQRSGGVIYLRGQTEPYGQYELFVPRDGQLISVRFYDPQTQSYALIFPRLRPDAPWRLPSFELTPINDSARDSDHDGLPDVVETVLGTDPKNPDSDGDGIPDGAEVEQGTNPLDGRITQTGVIATTQTVGPAIDVRVQDDVVITAEGTSGISVFTAYNGSNPVLLSHVNTGGNVQRVAFANGLVLAAQPDKGLAIVDLSDLASPQIRTVALSGAQTVVGTGSRAFVGTSSGAIVLIDIPRANVLNYFAVANAVWDLAIDRGYLYALTDDHLLVLSTDGASLAGSALSPFIATPNRRLSMGGGLAYTVHAKGYNVLDLTDPARPSLIRPGNTTQFGWRDLVSNGSGIGLATVGPNAPDNDPRDVSIYDLSLKTNTNLFITQLQTPGSAEAVVIYKGVAYLADRAAGLQVLNYLSYDDQKLPPRVSLTLGFDPNNAFVDRDVWLVANATDDLQVRSVELYLDDQKFLAGGAFPFEFHFPIPSTATGTFRLRARAIDTGGNASWSEEVTVRTVLDPTIPAVIATTPFGGAARDVTAVSAYFNKAIDPNTITPANFLLYAAGPDGQTGTDDDVPVTNTSVTYDNGARAATLSFAPLPFGTYRAVINANVTDINVRRLAQDYAWDIRVIDARIWISPAPGNWSDPGNWAESFVPGLHDNALINAPVTVSVDSNAKIYNKVTGLPGARLDFQNSATLDTVTLDLDAHIAGNVKVHVKNGLTINRQLIMDGGLNITELDFDGAQTLGGTGTILYTDCNPQTTIIQPLSGGLTIGADLKITGGGGAIGRAGLPLSVNGTITVVTGCRMVLQGAPLLNSGRLTASKGGELYTVGLQNTGTIAVTQGAAITLTGNWNNQGAIQADAAGVNLGGVFTVANFGQITTIQNAAVYLTGTLENSNQTFDLDASRTNWVMAGGTIHGGTVQATAAPLRMQGLSQDVLDGVTVTGHLILQDSSKLTIRNGLTLNGSASINTGINLTQLILEGAQTLDGTADVLFTGGPYTSSILPKAGALTLGPNVTIHGGYGKIGDPKQPLINNGKITADGGLITIYGDPFTNNGTTQELNGGHISINP
jgi:hypothetical protein